MSKIVFRFRNLTRALALAHGIMETDSSSEIIFIAPLSQRQQIENNGFRFLEADYSASSSWETDAISTALENNSGADILILSGNYDKKSISQFRNLAKKIVLFDENNSGAQ